ncbi:MAG TPA: 50S ribosomal protein L3 N(5)-glutamine methyltransferase [Usitatibacter sp.]|jgi:ribosomal protein L3 glutamine methyltransferase|nr:50S ribosomal protein L3 N(5)-glutamine methyltransferase [Usitatibacter sp.]
MTRTVRALLDHGVERFERAGLSYGHGTGNALDEAAWIVSSALGLPPSGLDRHADEPLTEARYGKAKALLDARVRTRKPAAYLLNEAWLGPHKFYVDERVIVPRSFIAELLLKTAPFLQAGDRGLTPKLVLDLCTGSGCLAILAALAFPEAKVDAVDLSDDALEVAARNVADYKLARRVRLVKSDLFGALASRRYDLIVANPPYVKASSMKKLPDEYRKEPGMALASGSDGLDHTRRILAHAKPHLNRGGMIAVEIGHNRAALERAYPSYRFRWPRVAAGAGYVFTLSREDLP